MLSADAPIRSLVPTDDQEDGRWHLPDFDDRSWTTGIPGVGYDDDGDYLSAISLDVTETLRGQNLTIYLRSHFDASSTAFDRIVLGMKLDDGFVAYLNGSRIAAANAPLVLDWQSRAPEKGNDSEALMWQAFPTPAALQLKKSGNVLAIHGLNQSLDSSDFLIIPSLVGLQFSGGTIVADQLEAWPRVVARVRTDDGKWSPPARFDPAAPASESELFGAD